MNESKQTQINGETTNKKAYAAPTVEHFGNLTEVVLGGTAPVVVEISSATYNYAPSGFA